MGRKDRQEKSEVREATEAEAKPKPPAASVRKPHEAWAKEKGFLPMFVPAPNSAPSMSTKRPNPNTWKYRAAVGLCAWIKGTEVTEREFDAAVKDACAARIR